MSPVSDSLIEVVFNLPLRQAFTYSVPEDFQITPGYRVLAPFGSRRLTGYVVGSTDIPPAGVREIKQIQRPVDKRAVFDRRLLELARWLSDMYLCSLGEALATMLPGGRREVEPEEMGGELALCKDITLSTHQRSAIDRICAADGGLFYLHGVNRLFQVCGGSFDLDSVANGECSRQFYDCDAYLCEEMRHSSNFLEFFTQNLHLNSERL